MSYIEAKIDKPQQNSKSGLCGDGRKRLLT